MADPKNIADVRALLQEGKVQEADDLLANIAASAANAMLGTPAKPAEPPPPRDPDIVLYDFMKLVTERFGNHAVLEALCEEFYSVMHLPNAR